MYQKGLLLGGFNPPHVGHFELMKTALQRTAELYVLIGLKRKQDRLPYEIRRQAVEAGIYEAGLEAAIRIHPPCHFYEVKVESYDVLALGSDLLNHLDPRHPRYGLEERAFFASFPNLLVLEREGVPINAAVLELVRKRQHVETYPPRSPVSATFVRAQYKAGADVTSLIPAAVRPYIDPHAYLFAAAD